MADPMGSTRARVQDLVVKNGGLGAHPRQGLERGSTTPPHMLSPMPLGHQPRARSTRGTPPNVAPSRNIKTARRSTLHKPIGSAIKIGVAQVMGTKPIFSSFFSERRSAPGRALWRPRSGRTRRSRPAALLHRTAQSAAASEHGRVTAPRRFDRDGFTGLGHDDPTLCNRGTSRDHGRSEERPRRWGSRLDEMSGWRDGPTGVCSPGTRTRGAATRGAALTTVRGGSRVAARATASHHLFV